MAMQAAVHKRNLESSILFMQQEHATTLKALHEEIHRLQKKCTDLTFHLTMNGINIEDSGDVDSRLQVVHSQLQESQKKKNDLEKQLEEKNGRVQLLEQELRSQKKRHLDEMRNTTQIISSLKAEVEAKSNNIAFLTTELHRLKVKQKIDHSGGLGVGGSTNQLQSIIPDPGHSIVRHTHSQYSHVPAPPRDMLTNSGRIRTRASHTVASPSVRRGVGVGVIASSSATNTGTEGDLMSRGLRVTSASARSSGSESPDITPFIHRDVDKPVPMVEVKKPALPPIAVASASKQVSQVHQVVIAPRGRHGVTRARPSTPEITTLAVDQVGDANWNRPPESHSSEYN